MRPLLCVVALGASNQGHSYFFPRVTTARLRATNRLFPSSTPAALFTDLRQCANFDSAPEPTSSTRTTMPCRRRWQRDAIRLPNPPLISFHSRETCSCEKRNDAPLLPSNLPPAISTLVTSSGSQARHRRKIRAINDSVNRRCCGAPAVR